MNVNIYTLNMFIWDVTFDKTHYVVYVVYSAAKNYSFYYKLQK